MKKSISCFAVSFLLLAIFFSCRKESYEVGGSLRTYDDALYCDTLYDIELYTLSEDSLKTNGIKSNLLGWVRDPVFGEIKSDIFAQFRLSANDLTFGEGAGLDSVVLSLDYAGFFGDTTQFLNLSIHELTQSLEKDSSYYSNNSLTYDSKNLISGSSQFVLHPLTEVEILGEKMSAQMRIPLDTNYFSEKFLKKSASSELSNNVNFLKYFKGISIIAKSISGSGCLAYFRMNSTNTAITFYYHNNEHDSLNFQLVSNDSTVYYSRMDHFAYSAAEQDLKQQLSGNYSNRESFYLQASGGLKTQMRFPTLKSFYEGQRIVVHKAELVIHREQTLDSYNPYFYPAALMMYYKKDSTDSKSYYMPDYLNLGSKFLGGEFQSEDNTYRFKLTEYVQYLLMGKIDASYPLYITVKGASTQATRLKYAGPQSASNKDKRMCLIVTYSYAGK